jgi:DNA invertase Pin-like site-specific DNA recombinase
MFTEDIIYLRVSTPYQTVNEQMEEIMTLSPNANSLVFSENVSAWCENVKRPEFDNVIKAIKSGKVKRLFVWAIDRIYRNYKRATEFLELCKMFKVEIHSFSENELLYPLYQLNPLYGEIFYDQTIRVLSWVAERESTQKSMRVKKAMRKNSKGILISKNGNKWGRKSFPKQTADRVMKLHEEGLSVREIASKVMVYDKNNNGKNISKSAVQNIVQNKKQTINL